MRCTPSLSEQLWRVRTKSGHETSCWLVEECGEFDLQLFDANGKLFFGCRFPDRAGALALSAVGLLLYAFAARDRLSNEAEAVSAIQQQHPDLVFLDVQMPACDGFGVIQQLGPEQVPAVVFVTAYDEYALKAFEVHAIDYLLKPFGRDRFAQTLQHAREHLERRRAGDLGKRLMALVQDIKPEPQRLDRLVVKSGGRVFFLRTQEIDWIEAAGNYVRLHLGEESHLFRETMNNMEGRLDAQRFVRIHRSRIVNTDRIKEMQPWFNGEYVVVLQNGTRLTLSRGYREKLQERLGKGF
jgi:two-component system LytT family response regulator